MSFAVTSLWENAGEVMDGDIDRRQFIEARLAAAKVWRVLAGASSKADFDTRKFLVRDHLEAAAKDDPRMLERLEASLDQDFEVLRQSRLATRKKADLEDVRRHMRDYHGFPNLNLDLPDMISRHQYSHTTETGENTHEADNLGLPRHTHGGLEFGQMGYWSPKVTKASYTFGPSAAEEQAAKRKAAPFSHTFHPINWDVFDARPHPGSSTIEPGSRVKNHGYMSPPGPGGMRLVHIEDENGNHQTVDTRSIQPLRRGRAASLEVEAWTPDESDVTPMARKLMDLAAPHIRGSYGGPDDPKRREDVERVKGVIAPHVHKVTDADQDVLEDYNYHTLNAAIDQLKGTSRYSSLAPDAASRVNMYAAIFGMRKGAPFADYKDFDDCTKKNEDKENPDAYCGEIKHRTEDKDKKESALQTEPRNLRTKTHDTEALRGHIKSRHKTLDPSKSWQGMWYDHYGEHNYGEGSPNHTHTWEGTGKVSAYQPDWENRAYDTLSDNGKAHPPHKLPRRPADDEGDWGLLRPDMQHLIHEHGGHPETVYSLDPKSLEQAHQRRHSQVFEASIKRTAALDPTQMQPGDSVTVHYHTADGQSGTCPATFTGPVDDTAEEDPTADPAAKPPVATATRKKAAFPPAVDDTAPPVDPSDVDPASTAPVTYAFDYANGTFFISDDGTGQWVDPAGSTFTFSAGDEGEDPAEDVDEEEETADSGDGGDDNAPPWAKNSKKLATAALRCYHCGGAVEHENIDPDWGDLQLCKGCEHNARSTPPDTRTENEKLSDFRKLHAPQEDPNHSGAWLDAHSKKTAVGANPFLPGSNPFSGGNPYTTPTPTPPGPDAAADADMSLMGDEEPVTGPQGAPGGPGAQQPRTHPSGAPGGSQNVPAVPQPPSLPRATTSAVSVVCTACGIQGEVSLSALAKLVREGVELYCPKCGSIEVDAIEKTAEDFSGFSSSTEPGGKTMSLPFNELHDVPQVQENARCSKCFTIFPHTASNPNEPIPPCPNCGSLATTVAGGWTKGAGKLEAMVAAVRSANPKLPPKAARKLAERALVLAGG